MNTSYPATYRLLSGLVLALTGSLALAEAAGLPPGPARAARLPFEPARWQALDTQRLQGLRGGFDLGAGIRASLGIDRSVRVNGELLSRVQFTLPDLSRISAEQARAAALALGQLTQVRDGVRVSGLSIPLPTPSGPVTGPGALAPPLPDGLPGATLIQNSLNNQWLQQVTIVQAGVNTLGLLKAAQWTTTLQEGLARALAPR